MDALLPIIIGLEETDMQCRTCLEDKPLSEFYRKSRIDDSPRVGKCKSCRRDYTDKKLGDKRVRLKLDHLSPYERLIARMRILENGCWEYTGALGSAGYGQVRANKKLLYAHHISYEKNKGSHENMCVLHRCDNPSCFNPEHLFLGTHQDNMMDMTVKGRNKGLLKMNGLNSRWESVRASV